MLYPHAHPFDLLGAFWSYSLVLLAAWRSVAGVIVCAGPQTNGHAGPEQTPQGRRWRGIAKIAGAGAAVLAAGAKKD